MKPKPKPEPPCTMRLALDPREVALVLDALRGASLRLSALHNDAWQGEGGDFPFRREVLSRTEQYNTLMGRFRQTVSERRQHQCDDYRCLCHEEF